MRKILSLGRKAGLDAPRLGLLVVGLAAETIAASGQPGKEGATDTAGWTTGRPESGERGIQKTMAEIMAESAVTKLRQRISNRPKLEIPGLANRPQNPDSPLVSQWPVTDPAESLGKTAGSEAPQPVGSTFDTVTGPNETSAFPPDTMGAVGPAQFIVALNGRLRSFTKAGVPDGVLDLDTDAFLASVLTPLGGGVEAVSANNPQIRYDRLSGRWIITMADVPSSSNGSTLFPNRLLIAVSDAASAGVITAKTVWTFYFVQQNTVGGGNTGEFADFPSLGIDNNALYIGCNMFVAATRVFVGSTGFVVRKSSILSGGPVVVTAFRNIATATAEGPASPRGVDNYDPASNEGYFIGVSILTFGRLDIRRVTNPGGTPSISGNVLLTVPATSAAIRVDHLGNIGGTAGRLDGRFDELFAAHIRNGRLWTAHGNAVNANGVSSSTGSNLRNGVRWYELNGVRSSDNGGVPMVVQSGTVFDNATNASAARQFWVPTVMVSGQRHAAFAYSTAGTPFRADCATNGRLSGDSMGTSGAVSLYTAGSTAYNPPGDPGGTNGRHWGNYSFTSLDPLDDITFWTIQEYCNGTNTYGCKVAKLLAPPPAAPSSASPNMVAAGQLSVDVTITGSSGGGSAFFDPGANLPSPALPFDHISASVPCSAATVNSVTFNNETSVTLNLNTTMAVNGTFRVTITNPDGQSATSAGTGILTITGGSSPVPLQLISVVSRKTHGGAGTFDITLPLTGEPGLESRSTGGDHSLVFTFSNNVLSADVAVTSGVGGVSGSLTFSGNTMTVNLTGVTNAQRITIAVSNATDSFCQTLPSTTVDMNVLAADVSVNKLVNASDVSLVKSRLGQAVDGTNFRADVNANGSINAGDVSLVKSFLGTGVP